MGANPFTNAGLSRYLRDVTDAAWTASEALFERSVELARIGFCLDRLRDGDGRVLVLEGRAGIGKTRLLQASRELSRSAGIPTLSARGSEIEQDLTWGVVRQLFEPALRSASGPDRERLLSGAAKLAAPLLGWADEAADPLESAPEDRSFSMLHGLYWLTANLACGEPLILVVDDAQWADPASLRFLGYLAGRLGGLPVGILIAARLEDVPGTQDIGAQLGSALAVEIVRPDPLSVPAAGALLHDVLAAPPDPGFAAACHAATGGLPFLVRELARDLREQRVEPVEANLDAIEALGHRSIARNIRARVGQLGRAAERLAQAAAVLGPVAELRHAAAIAELGHETASAAADGLAAAGIIEDGRPIMFVHPIVRHSIYHDLRTGDRAGMHAQAARLFADEPGGRDRVATHLALTEPGEDPWVVETLHAAAHEALSHGAPRSAVTFLRRALAEPPAPDRRWAILRDLGFAESYAREPDATAHLEEALRLAPDTGALVGTTLALGRMLQLEGRHDEAAAIFEHTLERIAGEDEVVQLKVEGSLVAAGQLDLSTARRALARVPRLRQRAEELAQTPSTVFGPLALAAAGANEPAPTVASLARRALRESKSLLPEAPDRPPFFYYATTALMFAEEWDETQALLDRSVHDAQRLASLPHYIGLSAFRGWLHQRRGALADAEEDARTALTYAAVAPAFFTSLARAVLIDVLVERGATEEAYQVWPRADEGAETGMSFGILLGAVARLKHADGRHEEALADLRHAERHMLAFGFGSPVVVTWRSDRALVHYALGDQDSARQLAHEEVELARAFGVPRALGCSLRAAGQVHDGDGGIAMLREAVDHLAAARAPLDHARALTDLGAALRRRGHRVEARDALRTGMELAYRCQASVLAERARTELVASGARPRRPVSSGVEALTPSERRVAQMAAIGHTNREIAQALFVTARTVEGHLTHVFQKLGVRARTELSDYVGAEPAVTSGSA